MPGFAHDDELGQPAGDASVRREGRNPAGRGIVAELQAALLPTALPVLPRARIAARYLVAGYGTTTRGRNGRLSATDKAKNKAQEMKGKAKEAAGKAVGNERLEAEGVADQAKGNVKQAGEKVKDAAKGLKP